MIAVYALRVGATVYVGASKNAGKRYHQHLGQLRHNLHPRSKLQAKFNELGENQLTFEILEEFQMFDETFLSEREYFWAEKMQSVCTRRPYYDLYLENQARNTQSTTMGVRIPPELRKRIFDAARDKSIKASLYVRQILEQHTPKTK